MCGTTGLGEITSGMWTAPRPVTSARKPTRDTRSRCSPASCAAHNPNPCACSPGRASHESHQGHSVGRLRGRPVDGASARDLRAEVDEGDSFAQLTGLVAPPTALTLARALHSGFFWGSGDTEQNSPTALLSSHHLRSESRSCQSCVYIAATSLQSSSDPTRGLRRSESCGEARPSSSSSVERGSPSRVTARPRDLPNPSGSCCYPPYRCTSATGGAAAISFGDNPVRARTSLAKCA